MSFRKNPEMTMEIEGEDGTRLCVKTGAKAVFGRGEGFNTDDLTVSRRHVSFEIKPSAAGTERSDMVFFEVLGRNPVWVRSGQSGKKIRTFRKSEAGVIVAGDQFCVSGNHPIWFKLKSRDEEMEKRDLDGDDEFDVSIIDPVKEFRFLVIGKEFDQYLKSRMRDVKQWEWFLEDSTNRNSDDEDEDEKRRKRLSKKRRRKKGNEEDDDWSVESEEDKELMVKSKRVVKPTYLTRSKKTKKDTNTSTSRSRAQTKQRGRVDVEKEEEDDDDDDDETLGGFIISDEEAKLEEEDESDVDDEEEDLADDEDEDEE